MARRHISEVEPHVPGPIQVWLDEHDAALDAAEAAIVAAQADADALEGPAVHKLAVAINATAFDALGNTDTSETIDLGTALPANARILGVNIKLTTPFTGGGNAAVTLDVGSSGDPDALVDGADLFAAAVDGLASTVPRGIAPSKHFATSTQLTGTFVADVGLKELTAGAGTVEVLYSLLA